jgi:hypothetical protein
LTLESTRVACSDGTSRYDRERVLAEVASRLRAAAATKLGTAMMMIEYRGRVGDPMPKWRELKEIVGAGSAAHVKICLCWIRLGLFLLVCISLCTCT